VESERRSKLQSGLDVPEPTGRASVQIQHQRRPLVPRRKQSGLLAVDEFDFC
jgi:hypothetical protein